MMKFSSTAVLLILSLFIAGSSWSGSITLQRDMAEAHAGLASVRLLPPERDTPPLPAALIPQARAAAADDVWLTLILGGVLVALQLRRTQRNARLSRLSL
jgi:hypothetical protein